jgi:hypothetical protein
MFRSSAAGRLARLTLPLALSCCFVAGLFFAQPAKAQFRNNGMQFPHVGWQAMGTSTDWFNGVFGSQNRWNVSDQALLGVGYFRAIGYNLWFDSQVTIGLGTGINTGVNIAPVLSQATSVGLRYNFLDEKHRPFIAGHIQYILLLYDPAVVQGVPINPLLEQSLWVGPRLGGGYEFFFAEEMSLQVEAGAIFYLSLAALPGQLSGTVRLSYNFYF